MEDELNTTQDLIRYSYNQKPIEFEDSFNTAILDRISKLVDAKKDEIAQGLFDQQNEYQEDDSEE